MVFLYIQFKKKQEYFSKDTYRLLFSKERHQKACSVDSSLINFDSKQENPELMKNFALVAFSAFDAVGWAAGRASGL